MINPNMQNIRRCCVCGAMLPVYKCDKCNLYFCAEHDTTVYFHIHNNDAHERPRYEYYKCCDNCCSNCYIEECSVCGDFDSNLNMTVVQGSYRCSAHN